jgi:hypothetical protein
VPGHRCRVEQVVCQQLHPATTTRGGFSHRRRADGLRILDLRGADNHLQSSLWQRDGSSLPVATAASSAATSICSGVPPAASGTCGVNLCMGTAAGMSLPSSSAPVKKKTSALATTTTLWGAL